MNIEDLHGVIAPFTTPFREDGTIDLDAIKPQVDWLLDNGCHGLAAGGSTGEGHVLERADYMALMTATRDAIGGRVPLVAGIVCNATDEVAARGREVRELGVVALQVTPPHYLFRPDDDAMVAHFRAIHAECEVPILIYNVVPWTYLSPQLLDRILTEVDGVIGVKQSAGDVKLLADLLVSSSEKGRIMTAVEALLYPSFALGAHGAIAAVLPAAPTLSVEVWDAVAAGGHEKAKSVHEKLLAIWNAINQDNLPANVKCAMRLQGREGGLPRPPMPESSGTQEAEIRNALGDAGLL